MTPEQMAEAVRLAEEALLDETCVSADELVGDEALWSLHGRAKREPDIARALLSLHARLAAAEAVVAAAREWQAVRCEMAGRCGDPNDGKPDGTHDWLCPVDVAHRRLIDALDALTAKQAGERGE